MKRIVFYCIILIGAMMVPVQRQDIAALEPIQAVYLHQEGDVLVMQTDTMDKGTWITAKEALSAMQNQSSGIVYLDTAQYLLVTDETVSYIEEMIPLLKGSVKVCLWEGEGDLREGAKYMQAHKIGCRLDQWQNGVKMPKMPLQIPSK